jgi:hypothetical protein
MTEVLKTLAHKNIQIDVVYQFNKVQFAVIHAEFENRNSLYDTLDNAHAAIDRYYQTKDRLSIKDATISEDVLLSNGDLVTVTGIHRGTGEAKITRQQTTRFQKSKDTHKGDVYANRPWVKAQLDELNIVCARVRQLESSLRNVKVRIGGDCYGRKVDIERYEGLVTKLQNEITNINAQADRRAPKEEHVA